MKQLLIVFILNISISSWYPSIYLYNYNHRSSIWSKIVKLYFGAEENLDGLLTSYRVLLRREFTRDIAANKAERERWYATRIRAIALTVTYEPSQDPFDLWNTCNESRSSWFMGRFNSGRTYIARIPSTFTHVSNPKSVIE